MRIVISNGFMLFGPANDNAVSFLLSSEIAVNQVGEKVLVKSELYTTELFDLADVTGDLTAPTIGAFLTYLSTNFAISVVIGGFATETTLDLANQNLDNISASTGLKADTTANIEALTGAPAQENNEIQLLKAQNVNFGFPTQTAAPLDTSDVGFIGLFKRLLQRVTTLITNLGSPFQAGGSIGNLFGLEATQLLIKNQSPTAWTLGTGNVDASTQRVTLAADGATNTNLGATNETAAAADNSTSGLNGLLKRNNQRLTSLIAALGSPFQAGAALGAGTNTIGNTKQAGGITTVPTITSVTQVGTTSGVSQPIFTALAAASNVRTTIANNSNKTLFFAFSATANATNFAYQVAAGGTLVLDIYESRSVLSCIWTTGGAASGNLSITTFQ